MDRGERVKEIRVFDNGVWSELDLERRHVVNLPGAQVEELLMALGYSVTVVPGPAKHNPQQQLAPGGYAAFDR